MHQVLQPPKQPQERSSLHCPCLRLGLLQLLRVLSHTAAAVKKQPGSVDATAATAVKDSEWCGGCLAQVMELIASGELQLIRIVDHYKLNMLCLHADFKLLRYAS